jgi:organic hydroperoxide reductase OsmC/OhrA
MTEVAEVMYLAKSRTTGIWEHGSARRSGGHVDITPSALGRNDFSADPEQLFAAGWTTSFDGTMARAALKVKVVLSDNTAIDAIVDLYLVDGAYFLQARLNASLSDMPPEVARILADMDRPKGLYSKAIRGNIDVTIDMV